MILILAIANSAPLYNDFIKVWRAYMPLYSDKVQYYFIFGDAAYDRIEGDCVYIDEPETYIPGIFNKTIKALKLFDLYSYDYIVRTNLSSFFVLDKFLNYLNTSLPNERVYNSYVLKWRLTQAGEPFYGSGCLIILSPDVASFLLSYTNNNGIHMGPHDFDDIIIGTILWYHGNYRITDVPNRLNIFDIEYVKDIQTYVDKIPDNTMYIKVRNDKLSAVNNPNDPKRYTIDTNVFNELLYKYYKLKV